jgi:hypothetical protein
MTDLHTTTAVLLARVEAIQAARRANWKWYGSPIDPDMERAHIWELYTIHETLSARRVAEPETPPAGNVRNPHLGGRAKPAGNIFDRLARWYAKFNI